jgi:RNA polymerase sigma-70 factor (ECF subfamily)
MSPQAPSEVNGLLALMLLHDSRREARSDDAGEIVVLEEQDRTRWNQAFIAEALPLVDEALRREPGQFALEAAISAEHCKSAHPEDTNWQQIVRFYTLLQQLTRLSNRRVESCGSGCNG